MLTTTQRERILAHLKHGWKLPDSLVQELWEAYEDLERALAAVEGPGGRRPRALGQQTALAAPKPNEIGR